MFLCSSMQDAFWGAQEGCTLRAYNVVPSGLGVPNPHSKIKKMYIYLINYTFIATSVERDL